MDEKTAGEIMERVFGASHCAMKRALTEIVPHQADAWGVIDKDAETNAKVFVLAGNGVWVLEASAVEGESDCECKLFRINDRAKMSTHIADIQGSSTTSLRRRWRFYLDDPLCFETERTKTNGKDRDERQAGDLDEFAFALTKVITEMTSRKAGPPPEPLVAIR